MKAKLTLVLDTNVFLVCLAKTYKYYWIYEAILNEKFNFCVSNEILTEYQEVIEQRYGMDKTNETIDFLLLLPNVKLITPYYQWNLIEKDEDDNKFVDCAIAGNAHFLVSNDKHFKVLKRIQFPKVSLLRVEEFEQRFKQYLL